MSLNALLWVIRAAVAAAQMSELHAVPLQPRRISGNLRR